MCVYTGYCGPVLCKSAQAVGISGELRTVRLFHLWLTMGVALLRLVMVLSMLYSYLWLIHGTVVMLLCTGPTLSICAGQATVTV